MFENFRLATAMTLWIEDPQLHKDSLYLPALPPQFLSTKLLLLIEGSQVQSAGNSSVIAPTIK